jgi:hypothetical protein
LHAAIEYRSALLQSTIISKHFLHGENMPKTAAIGLRVEPEVKKALDKAAADDRRPVASYLEILLVDHLTAAGYLKKK